VINSNGGSQQVIAITGIVSTAAVALMGLGVQLWLSRQQRQRDRREARYRELSGTYERVGRLGTALVIAITRAALEGEFDSDALEVTRTDRDATYLLVMHRASPEVRRAYVSNCEPSADHERSRKLS
jgi:hypothetical protein